MKTRVLAGWLSLILLTQAQAQNLWTGGADTWWTNANNWFLFTVPPTGEGVTFDANAAANLGTRLGADLTVGGLTVYDPAGPVAISNNVLTIGTGGIAMASASVDLTIAAGLAPAAAQTWSVATNRLLQVSGLVQGLGDVRKEGPGTVAFSANGAANVYSGNVTVAEGTMLFNGAANQPPLGTRSNRTVTVLSNAVLTANNGTHNPLGSEAAGILGLVISNGTFNVPAYCHISNLTMWAGTVTSNGASVDGLDFRIGSRFNTRSNDNPAQVLVKSTLRSFTTVDTEDGPADVDLSWPAPITGSSQWLAKRGAGTLLLNGTVDNNSLRVQVSEGLLVLAKTNSVGAHAAALDAAVYGGTMKLAGTGGDQIFDGSALTVEGGLFDMNGLSEAVGPLQGISTNGTILNSATGTLSVLLVGTNNGSGAYYGNIAMGAGTVRVVKVGTGTQTFGGHVAVDYLVVSNGIIQIGGGPASWSFTGTIDNQARVDFASQGLVQPPSIIGTGAVNVVGPFGGVLFTNTASFTGPLTVAGGFVQFGQCIAAGDLATTLNMASGTVAFARSDDVIWSTAITGGVNVLKLCDSTLTLAGGHTYTGGTRVAAGRVLVTGSLGDQRYVSIFTNASFDAGTAAVTIAPSGRLAIAGNRIDTWENGRLQVSRPAGGSLTNADIQLVALGGTFDLRGGDASAPLFPSNDLTNQLAIWLRADAGVQRDGSGLVTNWLDSSKYARDMRVTGTRPGYVTAHAALNNRPAVQCTGLNRLKTADITGAWPTRNCSVFIVARATNAFNLQSYFLTMVTTTNEAEPATRFVLHFPWNDGNVYMGLPYGNWLNYQPGAAAMSQFGIWFMRNSGGGPGRPRGRMIVRNGNVERADGTAPVYDSPAGRHLALAGYGSTGGWQGDVAEVMLFTNALTRTEEEQVGYYLARKYGFEGVYADQPAAPAPLNLASATLIVSNNSAFFGANATTVRLGAVQLGAGVTSTFHNTIANFEWPDNGFLPGAADDQTQTYPAFASYDMPISGAGAVVITNGITRFTGNSLHTYTGGLYLQNFGRLVLAKTNNANNAVPTNIFLYAGVWNTGAGSFHGGIELEADEQIPDSAVLVTGPMPTNQWNGLRTYGHTETIAGMTGNYFIVEDTRASDTNGHGIGTFIVSNDVARTWHGILRDNDGGTNRIAFTKRGAGTLTFATGGDWLNWSGPTKVYDGELVINNSGNPINGVGAESTFEVFTNATLTYGQHNHHGQWNGGLSVSHTVYEGGTLRNNGAWVNVMSNVTLCGGTWLTVGGYDANQKAWSVRGTIRSAGTNTTSAIIDAHTNNTYWGIGLGSNQSTTNVLDVADGAVDVDLKLDASFFDTFNNTGVWPESPLRKTGAGKVVVGHGQGFTGPFSVEGGTVIMTNSPLSGELDLSNGVQVVMTGGRGLVGEYKMGFSSTTNFDSQAAWDRYWAATNSTHLYSSREWGLYGPRDVFDFDGGGYNFMPPYNRNNGTPVFEARWRGKFIAPTAGVYTFFTASDDGSMLWIDGTNLVYNNYPQGVIERSNAVPVTLTAGEHDIAYHFHNSGGAYGFYSYFTPPGGVKQAMSNEFLRSGSGCGGLSGDAGTRLSISNYLFTVAQRYDRTFGGSIDGDAGLLKTCVGRLTLAGTNTYLGATEVRGGLLQLASGGAWNGRGLLVEDGTFDLNGNSITCTNFDGARGTLTNSAAAPVTVTLNPGDANVDTFLGNVGGAGDLGLTKSGTNLLWLAGNNRHNGPFAINGGVLRYDGSNAGTGSVTMAAGTILCGTGTLGGAVSVPNGSFIGPKPDYASTGTLSMASLSLSGGATLVAFLNGTNPTLRVTAPGGLSTGGTTNRVELRVAGSLRVGTYPLIDYAGSLAGGGFGALVLAGLPPGVTGSLNNNTIDGMVELVVTAVDQLRWTGAINNLWDTNTLNWVTAGGLVTNYYEGVGVLFNDLGTNNAITVQATGVNPASITVSNLAKVYAWGGGAIGGAGGIQKLGAGLLVISNANTFLDDIVISNGTVRTAAATALGSLNGGTYVRSGGALDLFGQSIGKEHVYLAGTGVTNEGCYYNTAAYINGRGTNTPGWIKLLADATINGGTTNGFEFGRDAGRAILDWGGFKMTKIGTGNIWLIQCLFSNAADTVFTGGGVNLGLDDISNPAGVTNTWGVGDGSILYFYSDDAVRDDYPMDLHLTNAHVWANGGNQYPNLMRTIYLEGATNWLRGPSAGFISGSIVGTSRLARAEAGWWAISSTNTYTGGTLLNAGEFILGYGINNVPTNSGSLYGDIILNGGIFNYAHAIPQTVTNNLIGLGNAVNGYVNSRIASGVTFDASATVNMTSQVLRAGTYLYGQMFFRTGCVVNAYGLYIADLNNTAGDVTMNGGAVNLSGTPANYALRIGSQQNTGSLRMQGGLLTASNTQMSVGWDGTGILYMQGGEIVTRAVQLNANGNTGNGRLIVEGGRITIGAGGILLPGTPSTNYLGGGVLGALENWTWDAGQPGYLSGTNGNLTFDSGTNTVIVNGWLSGTGGVNKVGDGRLLVNGTNTFSGTLVVSNGSVFGVGSLASPVAVRSNAVLGAVGLPVVGTLTISNNVALDAGAVLGALLNGTNPTLRITGALSNGASTLVRVYASAPAALGTYPLVDYTGTLAGVFSSVFQLQSLPAGVTGYLTNNTANTTIDLVVTNVTGGLRWYGDLSSSWDNALTANWRNPAAAVFNPADPVLFDDTATNFAVSIGAPVEPVSVLFSNVTQTYQLSGAAAIAGAGTLTKLGAGTVALANTNTFTGVTTVREGVLQVGIGGTAGDLLASPVVVTNGGTLVHYRTDAANTYRVPTTVSGNGTWILMGSGSNQVSDYLLTNGNPGFAGTMVATNARVQITNMAYVGSANLVAQSGGQFLLFNITQTRPLTVAGQGWLEGGTTRAGAVRFANTTNTAPITLAADARLTAYSGNSWVSGNIGGGYTLESWQNGSQLYLSGTNTFNHLNLVGGWLQVNNPQALGTGTIFTAGGGLSAYQNNVTIGNNLRASNTLYLGYSTTAADMHDLTWTGSWDLGGAGRQIQVYSTNTVLGAVTNGGLEVLQNGLLVFNSDVRLSFLNINYSGINGFVRQDGGTVSVANAGGTDFRIGHWSTFGSYTLNAGVLSNAAGRISVGWDGTGYFNINGGTVYSPWIRMDDAGTDNPARLNLTGGQLILGAGGIDRDGTGYIVNLGGGTLGAYASWAGPLDLVLTGTNGAATVNSGGYTITLSGAISGTGALSKAGSGALVLNGPYTAGPISVGAGVLAGTGTVNAAVTNLAGATMQPGLPAAAGALTASSVTFTAGSVLQPLANGTASVLRVTGTNGLTLPAASNVATVNVLNLSLAVGTYTVIDYAGAVQGGDATNLLLGITPPRSVMYLTNNAANTSIDLVVVQAGEAIKWYGNVDGNWNINAPTNWLTATGAVATAYQQPSALGDALVFDDTAVGNFNITLLTNVAPAAIVASNAANDYTIGGSFGMGGLAALQKYGGAMLTLTASNSFFGGANIQGGIVRLAGSGALGDGAIVDQASLVLANDNTSTLANAISGAGRLVMDATGRKTLTGALTYNGATIVSNGTLVFDQTVGHRFSSFVIENGGTLVLSTTGWIDTLGLQLEQRRLCAQRHGHDREDRGRLVPDGQRGLRQFRRARDRQQRRVRLGDGPRQLDELPRGRDRGQQRAGHGDSRPAQRSCDGRRACRRRRGLELLELAGADADGWRGRRVQRVQRPHPRRGRRRAEQSRRKPDHAEQDRDGHVGAGGTEHLWRRHGRRGRRRAGGGCDRRRREQREPHRHRRRIRELPGPPERHAALDRHGHERDGPLPVDRPGAGGQRDRRDAGRRYARTVARGRQQFLPADQARARHAGARRHGRVQLVAEHQQRHPPGEPHHRDGRGLGGLRRHAGRNGLGGRRGAAGRHVVARCVDRHADGVEHADLHADGGDADRAGRDEQLRPAGRQRHSQPGGQAGGGHDQRVRARDGRHVPGDREHGAGRIAGGRVRHDVAAGAGRRAGLGRGVQPGGGDADGDGGGVRAVAVRRVGGADPEPGAAG